MPPARAAFNTFHAVMLSEQALGTTGGVLAEVAKR
jgi:hypothetical protein